MKLSSFDWIEETDDRTEIEEFVRRLNRTSRPYPRDRSISDLFSQQARKRPDAVALMQGDEEWSYGRLEERSNRLAHFLKERLGPLQERLVGVFLERSPELIAALLGILKAGGAYLPLDPEYPSQRLGLMIEDSAAVALLTQSALRQRLPRTRAEVLCLEAEAEAIEGSSAEALQASGGGDRLAYVIYTSGSTGRPKGAAVPQRGVVRLVKQADYAALEAGQVFVQYAPISFDASTLEIWGPLLNGARLAIMAPGRRSLSELCGELSRRGATTLWLTSSLFNLAIEEDPAGLRGLRQLLVGGEALSAAHVAKALKELPGCRLVNGYGPTENTTFSCSYAIGSEEGRERIPIGGPIANSTAFILDEGMGLSPLGATGELYVGGDGLARGYVGDPAQTAQRFLPHPFGEGERLYRTGDLARWRSDGSIEFLGRLDGQVKLRGYRIEPAEIEGALLRCDHVKEAVVSTTDGSAGLQLVAYITARQDIDVSRLRAALKRMLPDQMIPSFFVQLERLPLNPNGKVDRKLLPSPQPHAERTREAPASETEEQLLELWQETLGLPQCGLDDDFFELGGHSLLIKKMAFLIERKTGVALSFTQIYQAPTVRKLANAVLDAARFGVEAIDRPMVLLNSKARGAPLFGFPPGTADALGYGKLAQALSPYRFYGFNFIPSDSILQDYSDLLVAEKPIGPYVLFGYSGGGNLAFHVARELEARGESVAAVIMLDSSRFLERFPFPKDEPHRLATEFLNADGVKEYVLNTALRDKAVRNIERYYAFLSRLRDDHVLNAPIHLVVSQNSQDSFHDAQGRLICSKSAWAQATNSTFRIHQGKGEHGQMLHKGFLEPNVGLLKNILDQVSSASAPTRD